MQLQISHPDRFHNKFTATVNLAGTSQAFALQPNSIGGTEFQHPPCAIVRLSEDGPETIGRLCICRNYPDGYTLDAIVKGELYRDVIGVRWLDGGPHVG